MSKLSVGKPKFTSTMVESENRPSSSKGATKKGKKTAGNEPEKEKGFKMPAFSMPTKTEPKEVEKQKKKVIRRNKPPGEDLKKLKEILQGVRGQDITVQEFIGLVAPSTGDNADVFRLVLAENLTSFRTTARKIYETMTQDISDVLTNEHIQLTESSNEKQTLYNDKIVRIMNEIFHYCPDFDFEKYYTDKNYLLDKFPPAPAIDDQSDEQQALMRQEAYHRYQWLKSEGERMKEENAKLQKRMGDLKRQQRNELKLAAERELQAEIEREQLESKQEELEEKLEELNDSVEKALVETEDVSTDKVVKLERKNPKNVASLPKTRTSKTGKQSWAEKAAADIQTSEAAEDLKVESSKVSVRSKASTSKTRLKKKRRPPPPQEESPGEARALPTSPFHFSPIKTPPPAARQPRERSPFHFSPIKTPPASAQARERSPFHYSPPPQSPPRRRVETTTTVVEPRSQYERRGAAPRDTWGGFH